ncbi:MAG: PAS domain-containing protein [Nitrospirae bacterium]|nr:PAS domain-containing protein [Nitrospirota bacterium]
MALNNSKSAGEALFAPDENWDKLFDMIPDAVCILDRSYRIVRINKSMSERLGLMRENCIGTTCYEAVHEKGCPADSCPHTKTLQDGSIHTTEGYEKNLGGWFLVTTSPWTDSGGNVVGSIHIARDISERKKLEEERGTLISELRDALTKVKQLSGFLPICASCKKIRDDKGCWQQIECYIRERSEAEFSHGVCPDCAKKLYAKYYKK